MASLWRAQDVCKAASPQDFGQESVSCRARAAGVSHARQVQDEARKFFSRCDIRGHTGCYGVFSSLPLPWISRTGMTPHILIATLSSEPQVVTLVLDLLQKKGYPISEVIVVHTVGEAVQPALKRLSDEFASMPSCRYRPVPVDSDREMVSDILTEADTAGVLRTTRIKREVGGVMILPPIHTNASLETVHLLIVVEKIRKGAQG